MQRSSRSLRLTEAGRTLVAQSVDAFAQIARGVAEARDQAGARGLVRVSAPVALGRQFCRAEPAVRVELDLSDRLVTLAHEGFDLAIRHAGAPPDNHVAWRLDDSASVIAASSAYLRRHGTPAHPADLARHACLTYLRPGPALWPFERRGAAGEEPERVHVNVQGPLRANNSEVLRDAALDGLGIALLPDFSAADALARGRLRLLLPQWRPVAVFGDAIWALRPWPRRVRAGAPRPGCRAPAWPGRRSAGAGRPGC
ncbi:substrate binding domain-containing protein [Piscinibacter sakaiensis]